MKTITIEGIKIEYYSRSEIYKNNNIPADDPYYVAYQIADPISAQLHIPCPDIGYVPNLQQPDYNTGLISIQCGKSYTTNVFPELTNNLIAISTRFSDYEILVGIIAHEMRHIWQQMYRPLINRYPAQGFLMSLKHPAEIDADGYAIYYMSQALSIDLEKAGKIICPEEHQYYPRYYSMRQKKATKIEKIMYEKSIKKSSVMYQILRFFHQK